MAPPDIAAAIGCVGLSASDVVASTPRLQQAAVVFLWLSILRNSLGRLVQLLKRRPELLELRVKIGNLGAK